eukprot:6177306-Alexandrium_andersonii.AAC.1
MRTVPAAAWLPLRLENCRAPLPGRGLSPRTACGMAGSRFQYGCGLAVSWCLPAAAHTGGCCPAEP